MTKAKKATKRRKGQSDSKAMLGATDWKEIATQLARRLNYVLTYVPPKSSQLLLNMKTGETESILDFLADGLELMPGVKVDRELLHMTPDQRRKAQKAKAPNR